VSLSSRGSSSLVANGKNIFAGVDGVWISTNMGQNWFQSSLNNRNVISLVLNDTNIFAGTDFYNGVYRSSNNGLNWVQTSLSNQWVRSLAITGTNVFAGTDGNGVFITTNYGQNWIQKNEGLGNLYIYALTIENGYVFAGTFGGSVWRRSLTELIGIKPISSEIPNEFYLYQNYPNPFNPATTIKYDLPKSGDVSIKVYDLLGKEIYSMNEFKLAGTYSFRFDGTNHASGVYFYKIEAGSYVDTKKMVLLK
jgi:hypothetical protein